MKRLRFVAVILILALTLSVNAAALETSAKSAILINADTLSVLYSHNAETRLPMASTTKIMTALLLAEQNTPERTVTTTTEMVYVEGSSMGLKVGDTVTFRDLLYGILLPSGNDAANTAAVAIAGSAEKFAVLMNNKAHELGLHNTNFVTASGLDAEGHYTTAHDLAVLTAFALKNVDFANAAASKTKKVTISGKTFTLTNHNKLLGNYDGAIGVKTGFTSKAGRCLVSAARRGNTTLIAVTLNDRNDWADHKKLLDYGFGVTEDSVVFPKSTTKLPLLSSTAEYAEIAYAPLNIGLTASDEITTRVYFPRVLFSPVKAGETVGITEYYSGEHLIKKEIITVKEDCVEPPLEKGFLERLSKIYKLFFRSI